MSKSQLPTPTRELEQDQAAGVRFTNAMRSSVRKPAFWGVVGIILLLGVNLLKDPTYMNVTVGANGNLVGNPMDLLKMATPIMLVAVGMSLVIATRGIDLSVGSIMVVSGATSMELLKSAESGSTAATLQAIGLAMAIGLVLGLINGVLVAYVGLQPFITTLIMMLSGRGLAKVITGGQNTSATNDGFRWLFNGTVFGFPVVFLLGLAVITIVALVVRRTALGLMIESTGINPEASRMAGIKPRGLLITVYMLSAGLSAFAGMLTTSSSMNVNITQTGYLMEMDAILAVVIGGTSLAGGKFSMGGAVVGAILIATLTNTVVFQGVPSSAAPAFKATIIIILCLLQSERVRNSLKRRKRPKVESAAKASVPA